jgi:hypothetical protein
MITMRHKIFKFIKDLLFALLLLYFIDSEFLDSNNYIKDNTTVDNEIKAPDNFNTADNNNNINIKIICTAIALTLLVACLWWKLSNPVEETLQNNPTDYIKIKKEDFDFIVEQIKNMKEHFK